MRIPYIAVLAVVALSACSGAEPECTTGAFQCDGDVLNECVDEVWTEAEDCGAQGLMCHEEMGHCMEMSEMDSGMSGM